MVRQADASLAASMREVAESSCDIVRPAFEDE